MRRVASARAFTLIELMIAVAIMGILIEFLPSASRLFYQVRRIAEAHTEIAHSALALEGIIGRDLKGATSVARAFKNFAASDRCLILETRRVGSGGRLLAGAPDHIVFALDPREPSRLVKEVFPSPGSRRSPTRQILAQNVLSLKFTVAEGAKLVLWDVAFGSAVEHRVIKRAFSSAAALRTAGL